MFPLNPKKRQRAANNHHRHFAAARVSSTSALVETLSDRTISETSQKIRRTSSHPHLLSPSSCSSSSNNIISFNDPSTADVLLLLYVDPTALSIGDNNASSSASSCVLDERSEVQIYLHSDVLRRAKYFSALLSDRWKRNDDADKGSNHDDVDSVADVRPRQLKLGVPPRPGSIDLGLAVLELLYTNDFPSVITSVSAALDLLPVALELLFEDCVSNCVRFLEAVPWNEEEERRVLQLVPFLSEDESKDLLARLSPAKEDSCEEMLQGLISAAATNNQPNMAYVKAFVAKLLRDFSSRNAARTVLEKAFQTSLKVVKESLEMYSSPDVRGDHNEIEAIQRLNLHTAMTIGKQLLWLVERMIELRVADNAVKEWSEQSAFTADLQRAFRDDAWRNIVPGLPAIMIRCTYKLASAVAAGTILAARQVRMKLVSDWLPVLIICKDKVSPMSPGHKALYMELEETFLRIISTLPMSDSQELLQQCLSLSTRNVDDCPHLISAFNTWFRRATRPQPEDQPR
ncbi:BTB/POZ domain-containing protein At1g63850 [Linum grandiflorum]